MGDLAVAFAALLAFAWVPLPGFPSRWHKFPRWLVHSLPLRLGGQELATALFAIHLHDIVMLMLDEGRCVGAIFASWLLLKIWAAVLFHSKVRGALMLVCPVLLLSAVVLDILCTLLCYTRISLKPWLLVLPTVSAACNLVAGGVMLNVAHQLATSDPLGVPPKLRGCASPNFIFERPTSKRRYPGVRRKTP